MTEWDGRPQNPERDGWHWVGTGELTACPLEWQPSDEGRDGRWADNAGNHWSRHQVAAWGYLGPCLTPAEVEARVAAARDGGGREALTGALHPEFGSIYAPNGAATAAREAGRREGIEAALTAALRMWPEADDLHDAIRTLLEEGGR